MGGCAHLNQLGSQQLWQMLSIPIVLLQAARAARCTEIRGDLDPPTVFSRWPRAQQPRSHPGQEGARGFGGKNRVGWTCQQVAHAAGRRLIPAPLPHLHPAEVSADPDFFHPVHPAWSIWLLRRVGNSYVTRDDYSSGRICSSSY